MDLDAYRFTLHFFWKLHSITKFLTFSLISFLQLIPFAIIHSVINELLVYILQYLLALNLIQSIAFITRITSNCLAFPSHLSLFYFLIGSSPVNTPESKLSAEKFVHEMRSVITVRNTCDAFYSSTWTVIMRAWIILVTIDCHTISGITNYWNYEQLFTNFEVVRLRKLWRHH